MFYHTITPLTLLYVFHLPQAAGVGSIEAAAANSEGGKNSDSEKRSSDYEYVGTYYCKGYKRGDSSSCQYRLKLTRIDGGLVVMQKCELVNGEKVPIKHDITADSSFPKRSRSSPAGGLSVEQRKFVIKHKGDNDADSLVTMMKASGSKVFCSKAQEEDIVGFTKLTAQR